MTAGFYDQTGPTAFSLAVRVASDPQAAEEVVATVFAALDDVERAGASEENDSTHLLLAVRRQAFIRRQANRRRQGHTLLRDPLSTDLPGPAAGDTSSRLTEPQQERLLLALGALPPQAREAIELMFFDGLTEAELATRLGTSQAVVREQIRAGLVALRDTAVTAP